MKPKKQILVLEDDEGIRSSLGNILTYFGYEVIETGNSSQFIAAIDSKIQFDLFITDFNLIDPSFDGAHAVSLIREKSPTIPIIMITAESLQHWRVSQLSKLERTEVLEKPLNFPRLSDAFTKLGFDLK